MPTSKEIVTYHPVRFRSTIVMGRKILGDFIPNSKAIVTPNRSIEIWLPAKHSIYVLGDDVFDQTGRKGMLVAIKSKIVGIETCGKIKRCSIAAFVEHNCLHPTP